MRSSLEVYDLATGRAAVILQSERLIEAPNWDPTGAGFLVNGDGLLWRVPPDGAGLLPVDTGFANRCNNDHGISPDGRTIVLSHHTGRGAEIFTIPAGGGTPQRLTGQAPSWWHGWSPDGARHCYAAARGAGPIDIYTIGADGGPEARLTHGEGMHDGPDYSADGASIYYNCDRSGHAQIWHMAADGSGQRQLFADDNVNWFPHPSPCGRHLLYLAYPPGTLGHPRDLPVALVLADPEGGNRRIVQQIFGGQGTMNVPCWAPDGSAFAFMRYFPVA